LEGAYFFGHPVNYTFIFDAYKQQLAHHPSNYTQQLYCRTGKTLIEKTRQKCMGTTVLWPFSKIIKFNSCNKLQ